MSLKKLLNKKQEVFFELIFLVFEIKTGIYIE